MKSSTVLDLSHSSTPDTFLKVILKLCLHLINIVKIEQNGVCSKCRYITYDCGNSYISLDAVINTSGQRSRQTVAVLRESSHICLTISFKLSLRCDQQSIDFREVFFCSLLGRFLKQLSCADLLAFKSPT